MKCIDHYIIIPEENRYLYLLTIQVIFIIVVNGLALRILKMVIVMIFQYYLKIYYVSVNLCFAFKIDTW